MSECFSVEGDNITFNGRTVGALLPSLALAARRSIEEAFIDLEALDSLQADIDEAFEQGEAEGLAEGEKKGRAAAAKEAEAAEAEIEEAAYQRGFDAGQAASANAADAARVKLLLDALIYAHDKLLLVRNGVTVPGQFKGKPLKVGELKSLAADCCTRARHAVSEYRAAPVEHCTPVPAIDW